jgi:hypothetical protein
MMKVTASPTWHWSSRTSPSRFGGRLPITVNAGPIGLKQTLLPRSLDLAFSFKYQR